MSALEITDYGGRVLAVGDRVVSPTVRRFGRFSLPAFKEATVVKLGRTKVSITGRKSPVDPTKIVKVGP